VLSASSRKEKPVSNVENLSKKLDEIISRLDLLEKMILETPENRGAAAAVELARLSIGVYGEPLKLAERLKNAERYLRRKPIAQDEISRCIIQALAMKGALNISAITRQVTAMRGKASRRIVRERVKKLQAQGILSVNDGKVPTYEVIKQDDQ
jgi:predicted DNA-binding transcriptional regulator